MAFKPYCQSCRTWHIEQEGHVTLIERAVRFIDENDPLGDRFSAHELAQIARLEAEKVQAELSRDAWLDALTKAEAEIERLRGVGTTASGAL